MNSVTYLMSLVGHVTEPFSAGANQCPLLLQ